MAAFQQEIPKKRLNNKKIQKWEKISNRDIKHDKLSSSSLESKEAFIIDKSIKTVNSSKIDSDFNVISDKGIEMEYLKAKPNNTIINRYNFKYFVVNLSILVLIFLLIHFLVQQTHFAVLGILIGSIFLLGFGCISLLAKVKRDNKNSSQS